jgi:hypothetical protein
MNCIDIIERSKKKIILKYLLIQVLKKMNLENKNFSTKKTNNV